jgi:superfamily I DNA/RNA helicase
MGMEARKGVNRMGDDGKRTGVTEDKYSQAERERDEHVKAIIRSKSRRKVVVAGPGTGKTHLFKKALEGKRNPLVLSFINALVDELSIALYGMSEVRTLHSFARVLLGKIRGKEDVRIYPRLADIIEEDMLILKGEKVDFEEIFHTRDDANPHIKFYSHRKKYYDDFFGHSDVIFATVKELEKDSEKIPAYDLVVVDEFQDFNKLEVSLIDLLQSHSPMLLAGDDDQAIYDLKKADPQYIRQRHCGVHEYEPFGLPFCSRCTRVIVDSVNDIIEYAKRNNMLKDRIPKQYKYFSNRDKDKISDLYPKITHTKQYDSQYAWYIEGELDVAVQQTHDLFDTLVIAPTRVLARKVARALKRRGFQKVEYPEKYEKGVGFLDGLEILLNDANSNLGWRIVAGRLMDGKSLKECLEKADTQRDQSLAEFLPAECKKNAKEVLTVLRKVRSGKAIAEDELALLYSKCPEILEEAIETQSDELNKGGRQPVRVGIRRMPIKVATVQGSKGLQADFVFLVHFDDDFLVGKGAMTDKKVCDFLVSLTRARRKVYLVSSGDSTPTLLGWIAKERIEIDQKGASLRQKGKVQAAISKLG